VSVLLDTHILLWWFKDDRELSRSAQKIITDTNDVYVSAATAWEIAIKRELKKLRFTADLEREIEANGFTSLDITVTHALAAGGLPRHHDDPFDRMLVAQAISENLKLLTHDKALLRYGNFVIVA